MKLYPFQEPIFGRSRDEKVFALFMETGTGKTIVSIATIIHLYKEKQINFAIIIAPKMVCEPVWEYELSKFRGDLNYRLFKWIGGVSDTDKYLLKMIIKDIANVDVIHSMLPILLINVEAFSHPKIYEFITSILIATKNIVILDESTHIKNVKSIRTKGLVKLSPKANYKRILSGFPVLRSPEDLYTQIQFLGANLIPYASYYAFRNDYCNLRAMGRFQIVTGHKNLDRLAGLIKNFSVRVLKKDCLDLPDKVHTKRYVEMTMEQKRLYDQMKNEGYAVLKGMEGKPVFATTFLAQLSKLHQIANGLLLQQKLHIESLKYNAMLEMLENEVSNQATIWFWFVETLTRMEGLVNKKFGPGSCGIIHGEISHAERLITLGRFQSGRSRFLLATPGTLMEGQNLTCCDYVTYFNNSTHLVHRIQSEDRFHRIGQVNKVTYADLVTRGTVEDKILDNLQKNHKIGADILQDQWQQWFS